MSVTYRRSVSIVATRLCVCLFGTVVVMNTVALSAVYPVCLFVCYVPSYSCLPSRHACAFVSFVPSYNGDSGNTPVRLSVSYRRTDEYGATNTVPWRERASPLGIVGEARQRFFYDSTSSREPMVVWREPRRRRRYTGEKPAGGTTTTTTTTLASLPGRRLLD